jgi:hypothetical protein
MMLQFTQEACSGMFMNQLTKKGKKPIAHKRNSFGTRSFARLLHEDFAARGATELAA